MGRLINPLKSKQVSRLSTIFNGITHLLPIHRFVSFIAIFLIQIGHLRASNYRDPLLEGFESAESLD